MTPAAATTTERPAIVLVNLEFPPIGGPGVWRMYALAKYFDAMGHPVSVICSDRASWHNLRAEALSAALPPGIHVHRQASPFRVELEQRYGEESERDGPAWRRLQARMAYWLVRNCMPDTHFKWAMDCVRPTIAAIGRHRRTCLITSGPPHVSHLVGLIAAWRTKCTWIMDYRDLWLLDPTLSPSEDLHRRLLTIAERRCLRRADAVVTVTPRWVKQLREHARLGPRAHLRFHLVRNGHDLTQSQVDAVRDEPRRRDRLHLHFNGVMQISVRRTFGKLFEALEQLRESSGALPPLVITVTGIHPKMATEIRERHLEQVIEDVGYQSHADALRWAAAADALMVPVASGTPVAAGLVPAKAYEAMALGQHVLAPVPVPSDIAEMLTDYGRATVVDSADPAAIAQGLRGLLQAHAQRSDRLGRSEAKSRAFLPAHSRTSQVTEYATLVSRLMRLASKAGAPR